MDSAYIHSTRKLFEYYKSLADKTFEQLSEEEFFWKYNDISNSVASIINHMQGNMKSRFTDFLTSDGEKPWRNRDEEFEDFTMTQPELVEKWEAGWKCVFEAIDSIKEENFDTIIYIRNQGHTITDALNRQLAHYASHVGQIMYIGKMLKGENWKSLSIPKGQSAVFNAQLFEKEKVIRHFTDDFGK